MNLWVANAALSGRSTLILPFVAGVILVDCGFAAGAAWGYYAYLQNDAVVKGMTIVGAGFLIVLGIAILWQSVRDADKQKGGIPPAQTREGSVRSFFLGVMLCGSNPAFFMFWVFAIDQLHGMRTESLSLAALVIGVACGDAIWFRTITRIVQRGQSHFSEKMLSRLRTAIGILFIGLGLVALLRKS